MENLQNLLKKNLFFRPPAAGVEVSDGPVYCDPNRAIISIYFAYFTVYEFQFTENLLAEYSF